MYRAVLVCLFVTGLWAFARGNDTLCREKVIGCDGVRCECWSLGQAGCGGSTTGYLWRCEPDRPFSEDRGRRVSSNGYIGFGRTLEGGCGEVYRFVPNQSGTNGCTWSSMLNSCECAAYAGTWQNTFASCAQTTLPVACP